MSDMSMPPLSWAPSAQPEALPPLPAAVYATSTLPAAVVPFAWPTPPTQGYPQPRFMTDPEPCELEGLNGRVSVGELVCFDTEAGVAHLLLPPALHAVALDFSQFRRLTLAMPLLPLPSLDGESFDITTPLLPQSALSNCRFNFKDGHEIVLESVGLINTRMGVFTFTLMDPNGRVLRAFYPHAALATAEPEPVPVPEAPVVPERAFVQEPLQAPLRGPVHAPRQEPTLEPTLEPMFEAPQFEPRLGPMSPTRAMPAPRAREELTLRSDLSLDWHQDTEPMGLDERPVVPVMDAEPAALSAQAANQAMPAAPESAAARKPVEFLLAPQIDTLAELLLALENQSRMPMVRIGEALLALGYITESKLTEALKAQALDRSLPLGELMVRRGDITRANLQIALARKMGYPIVDVTAFPVAADAARRLPIAAARRLPALPLIFHRGRLVVALEDPSARNTIDEIEFSVECKVLPVLARAGTLVPAIERIYRQLGHDDIEPSDALLNNFNLPESDGANSTNQLLANLEQQQLTGGADEETPIEQSDNSLVRLINTMILEARQQGVSDIHIECQPGQEKVRIRFRRDGVMRPYIELPPSYRQALVARLKIMCDLDISERRKPQDGKINFGRWMQGQKLELRVATIPTANGLEDVVMRLLASARTLPLEDMGLQPDTLAKLKAVINRPYGMVLCVGPTGSGKTTTLHAALGHINTPERKIWTAEDPVEITQPGLRQVQVNPKIDWTFAKALRAFLRADPDVVMVGEIRDGETAQMAIEASLTGHLVMSTLHTNSAPETVTRLLDMGMDPFSFADSLLAVLAQRLVRRWCKRCVTHRPSTVEETQTLLDEYLYSFPDPTQRPERDVLLAEWTERYGVAGVLQHHHAPGCNHCDDSGFAGRVGLHELLVVSRELRHLIQTKARAEELQRVSMTEGMRTLRQDGILKVLAGLTAVEEVRAISNS